MNLKSRNRKEFGDFQTPKYFTDIVCEKLLSIGVMADTVIEPTCGLGSFLLSSAKFFQNSDIYGYEINQDYLDVLSKEVKKLRRENIHIEKSDFFKANWENRLSNKKGNLLVIGNFPWVTNSTQGVFDGNNLPSKQNFLNFKGIEAITGKANFDISEWMLIEILSWFKNKSGTIAVLVKTAVARKIIHYTEKNNIALYSATIYKIDAKKIFNVSVDACLLVMQFDPTKQSCYNYDVYENINSEKYNTVSHKDGMIISNLSNYLKYRGILNKGATKWRSGIKHDLSSVMEMKREGEYYRNGLGEVVDIEPDLLYPLMKGADIGSNKIWDNKFILITQNFVGMDTSYIETKYPKTWNYLNSHADKLDTRKSVIYKKNPRFSIFGVGDYSFKKWKVAICSLYKSLSFRIVPPIQDLPVQFDDTVYFLSFETQLEAEIALSRLTSEASLKALDSLIFWDDKRPIKTSILNLLDLEKIGKP